jgi:hypothetical protein
MTTTETHIRQFIIDSVDEERERGASDAEAFSRAADLLKSPGMAILLVEQMGASIVSWVYSQSQARVRLEGGAVLAVKPVYRVPALTF